VGHVVAARSQNYMAMYCFRRLAGYMEYRLSLKELKEAKSLGDLIRKGRARPRDGVFQSPSLTDYTSHLPPDDFATLLIRLQKGKQYA